MWEPLMVSHQPTKFGSHRHCGSGDIMFLVIEVQDSTCSLESAITIYPYNTWHESTSHVMLISPILFTHILGNGR